MKAEEANTPDRKDWFSADRPITNRVDDKLGRRSFAEALAAAVSCWKGRDSLVLALYGAWGTGKSSIKNMVLDVLRSDQRKDAPAFTEFNSWQFANREQLTEAFFDQIGVALGRGAAASRKDRKRLLQRWRRYAAYLRTGASLVAHTRYPLILALVVTAALVGIAATQVWQVTALIILILVCLAAFLRWSSKFAALVAGFIEPGVEIGRRGLDEIKFELSETLRSLSAPLLVVIDDVDRLIPTEVQELFQLIKVNADFPNLVYLLLFDRTAVERNIQKVVEVNGRDYLEKIVQVGFDVPIIERVRLHRILFEGLDRTIAGAPILKRFDRQRWGNLFFGGLQTKFRTLRDVNRFLSTLSFHVSLFRAASSFEVNPVDLIGLEVLRVFHPEAYRSIAANKELLTNRLNSDDRSDEKRQAILGIVNRVPQEAQASVREIVKQLFPTVEWALGGGGYGGGFNDAWYRDLLVCSENVFDRYFQLAIAEDDLPQVTIDRILDATGDRVSLRTELLALKDRGLLPVALDRLEAYKEQIPLEHAKGFITALFDACDDIAQTRSGMLELSPMMHANRIIYWYLRREPEAARRLQVLEGSIRETEGISLPVDFVSLESGRGGAEGQRQEALVDEEGVRTLQQLCITKIERAAVSGRLAGRLELPAVLYRWKEWAGDAGPTAFVQALVEIPSGAIALLKALIACATSHGMSDYVAREHWYISLGSIEAFVAWETIESVTEDLSIESLPSDEDRRAIDAFRRAVKRRRQGKPDFGRGFNMGDDED